MASNSDSEALKQDATQTDKELTQRVPERRAQQDEAMDSLGIIVGEITHDFNNILSLIFGYVEMALSEIPEGERARSDLEHVLAAGDRAKELVARILTYSKSTKLKRDEINIKLPIKNAIDYIKGRLPENVKLNVNIENGDANLVLSNPTEIYQVINNLCTNSLQAISNDDGEITVTLDYFDSESEYAQQHPGLTNSAYAKITVADNGCGMDMATIEKMYTPFFTTTRKDDNSVNKAGLGLTTVYNIISSQGGVIYVDSTVGEGTTFEVCLPLANSVLNTGDSYSLSPPQSLSAKHILFVDDEPAILEMAIQILESHNYKVTSFIDGNDAIEHFRQQPHEFDLVITDLIMPAITGTELSLQLAAINPNIPIILTTGFSEKITAATCEQWGISTVVNKPFSIHELLSTIEELS